MKTKKSKVIKVLTVVGIVFSIIVLLSTIAFFIYVGNYYKADKVAVDSLVSSETVSVSKEDNLYIFEPKTDYQDAVIFYPGGLVEAKAYSTLMHLLAKENILTIIVEMPFNLAFFDMNGADKVINKFQDKQLNWYMCGHSLGGVFMSEYLSSNYLSFSGAIFLASYSSTDLSNTNLNVLSIVGSEDKVINLESYNNTKKLNPPNASYEIIDGGNHSYFGNYGEQIGDGEATISVSEQQEMSVNLINKFVRN